MQGLFYLEMISKYASTLLNLEELLRGLWALEPNRMGEKKGKKRGESRPLPEDDTCIDSHVGYTLPKWARDFQVLTVL